MELKLNKSSNEILDKKFDVQPRGYNALDVDEYLDKIIKDYQLVENNYLMSKDEIDALKSRIKELEDMVKNLEIANTKLQARFSNIKDSDSVSLDNINILKRIHALENYIFHHDGIDPNTIK